MRFIHIEHVSSIGRSIPRIPVCNAVELVGVIELREVELTRYEWRNQRAKGNDHTPEVSYSVNIKWFIMLVARRKARAEREKTK